MSYRDYPDDYEDKQRQAAVEQERNGTDGEPVWSYDHENGLQYRWWGGTYISVYQVGEVIPFSCIGLDEQDRDKLRGDYDTFVAECDDLADDHLAELAAMQ